MNTKISLTALLSLLTACGTVDFSVADSGTDADPPTEDVQVTKPDVRADANDPKPEAGKSDTGKPEQDAGSDSKTTDKDAAVEASHKDDAGLDAGHETDTGLKDDAGLDAGHETDSSKKDAVSPDDTGLKGDASDDGHTHTDDGGSDSGAVVCTSPPKCSGNILLVCGDGGTVAEPCSGVTPICLELAGIGTCVPCEPGTEATPNTQCANDTAGYYSAISTCNAQGQWVTQVCSPSTPVCSGPSGTASCGGVCVPGSTQCGREYNGPNAGTGGSYCPNGASCSCFGSPQYVGIEECDNTGHWGYASDCVPGSCSNSFYCTTVAGQGVCAN